MRVKIFLEFKLLLFITTINYLVLIIFFGSNDRRGKRCVIALHLPPIEGVFYIYTFSVDIEYLQNCFSHSKLPIFQS